MKPLYITACILAALCNTVPAYATGTQHVVGMPIAQELTPDIRVTGLRETITKDTEITISFDTPMVAEDAVNTAPTEGYFNIRYAENDSPVEYVAKWVSESEISITITAATQPFTIICVEVPEGIKDLEGHTHNAATLKRCSSESIDLHYTGSYGDPQVIFIGGKNRQDIEALEQRIKTLYFSLGDKKLPAEFRPATAADAVAHWAAYDDAFSWDMEDQNAEAMAKLAPDTVLPHTWVCEVPGYPANEQSLKLIMPAVDRDYTAEEYKDRVLYNKEANNPDVSLSNTCEAVGKHTIYVGLQVPGQAENLQALLNSLEWYALDYRHNDTPVRMQWVDGALRTRIRGQEIVIRIDEQATKEYTRSYKLSDGRTVLGCTKMVLNADLGGENAPALQLSCMGNYNNIVDSTAKELPADWTNLAPSSPFIYSNVTNGQMMSHGSTTINCEFGRTKNVNVRLCKLSADARNVVRTINAYEAWYAESDGSDMPWQDKDKLNATTTNRINKMRIVPTELLPGVQQETTFGIEGTYGTFDINLAKEFPAEQKTGLYFVEICGESICREDNGAPVVNQGLIQVTDLGLLWKLNGKRIFAWGYQLFNGKEVPQGTLRMLDAKGNTLAETPLQNGMAQGDFPAGTKFLQLCTPNDSVVVIHNPANSKSDAAASWDSERLAGLGVPADELPQALIYTFCDRSLYRPGEVAHIKGMVRWVINNKLQLPEIESITATLHDEGKQTEYTVTPDANGSFTLDVTPQHVGSPYVTFNIKYKGDDTNTSPDTAALARYNVDKEEWYVKYNLLAAARRADISLCVEEFRRNEFEVESKLTPDWETDTVEINATATNFTTTPVSYGKAEYRLTTRRYNFYPDQWQDYRFGDFSDGGWAHFCAYYMDDPAAGSEYISTEYREDTLDARGQGSAAYNIPVSDEPFSGRIALTSTVSVTNGNEQTINSVQKLIIDPCEVYAGIKTEQRLMRVGQNMPVGLVAVKPDGEAWHGAPLQGKIKVVRTAHKAYRYGAKAASGVHNIKEEEVVYEAPVTFSGQPGTVEVPLKNAGIYTITAECTDTKGKTTASTVKHYVWGDNESPWYYGHDTELELTPDKDMYKAGDTANILVQTPVDAEVLVTVERGKVLRHYKRTVTVNNPVIQVPVEATDAPVVYVGVSMVQSAEDRKESGKPLVKMGVCTLAVEAADKVLSIELNAPQQHLLPTDYCVVNGVVKDAAGNPVPHADVTLYAEDEGTLQVRGYSLPAPQRFFYSEQGRAHGLNTYSALGQLYADGKRSYLGNKGVFIGGGGEGEAADADITDAEAEYMRENFTPCALWLGSIKTDENGCFSATYQNPDTLTRYRLMAVAADAERFGSAKTAYHVTKPIMLEPVAPLTAAEGDLLHMPVTVSMLPEQLAEAANGAEVEWKVSLSGSNVTLPEPEKTVRLKGNEPVTISFPIKTEKTGAAELQWRVQAASPTASGRLANCKDAVKLSFDVIPPTPFLRERICSTLGHGQSARLHDWISTRYRDDAKVELTLSTTPLSGLRYHLDYLLTYPYGCSEQLSSAVIPWILKPELESALGMELPSGKNREEVLQSTFSRLFWKRNLKAGAYSYWDDGNTACEYSPYVVLVSQLALEKEVNAPGITSYMLRNHYRALADTAVPPVQEKKRNLGGALSNMVEKTFKAPDMLSIYVLARAGELPNALLEQCIDRLHALPEATPEQRWMLALCARMVNHPMAETLRQEAEQTAAPKYYSYNVLPPLNCIKLLYAIADAPESGETAKAMRDYLDNGTISYSTWRNAWATIAVYEYAKATNAQDKKATVNGHPVNTQQPMQLNLTYGSNDFYAATGDTVYVNGYAEGHQAKAQPVQAINQGLKVTRRYEKLMPDGSWQPTATFAVGDVVQVHLTVEADAAVDKELLRHLVVEDRLPAAFEAVNPALASQALAGIEGVSEDEMRGWWYYCSHITNKEFLKDRVRFFAHYVSDGEMQATYVARVLRRGKVTAPATKAELMYRPEIRGLSIPQQFEIK